MRTLRTRWTAAACGLVVALAAAPSAFAQGRDESAGEAKPLAVVAFSSIDELMKDVDFLGSLAGQKDASQGVEQALKMFTMQKGLAGLDRTKPIGAIVQSSGDIPGGAICLPITDLNALLDVVKGFGVTSKDAGNGLMQVTTPQGQAVFLKNADGWALLSLSPDMLEAVPADPSTLLGDLTKDYDVSFRAHVQNMPEAYKQMAVQAMSEGAKQGLSQRADESDDAYKAREEQVNVQLTELQRFINELEQFTFGMAIDGQQQRAYIDFIYTALPGTKLAEDIAANSNATTNFAGFFQPDAAMTMSFASKMTGADTAQLDQMVDSLRTQVDQEIEDDEDLSEDEDAKAQIKSAVGDFIDALKATLQKGVIDGGATLNMTADSLTFVAGGYIADPAKVESGLKKFAEVAKEKEEDMPEVSWASDKHKDVTFHTMQAPVEDDEKAKKLFGEKLDIVVGIGKEAVYFGLGRDALAAVKKVIDDSAANPKKAVAPMEVTVALGQIMNAAKELADEEEKPQIEMVADMLANEASGRDHVRMVAQPVENGVRMRIEAEEGVLRAIGMAAMQQQMQGAGF